MPRERRCRRSSLAIVRPMLVAQSSRCSILKQFTARLAQYQYVSYRSDPWRTFRTPIARGCAKMTQNLPPVVREMATPDLGGLSPTIDVETAGRAFGIGRSTAYQLARSGNFPCKVVRAGRSYRVVTSDLLRVLGITSLGTDGPEMAAPPSSEENVPPAASSH